jgi:FlaA1/EpsC-like NDP-sugar epimerase
MNMLSLIGRDTALFSEDIRAHEADLSRLVSSGRFLVIGGAGSIGQAVTREIFKRRPKVLHVVDISENNIVELMRDIRSTLGYIDGDFQTFAIDCASPEFEALMRVGDGYDYVLNLSALKHVRSEKDPFTLMRLIVVNILNTISTLHAAKARGAAKYFCVSTDKATNPVNMMGASKSIMEKFLMRESLALPVSTARFANVAFSDGSLLHGFNQRFNKRQPISAPNDVRRYFVTLEESGELCLMSCLLGENRDIFFPKLSEKLHLITFSDIAVRYLQDKGFEAFPCESEEEARGSMEACLARHQWPCYFFQSDTTGEKDFEEFYTDTEDLDMTRFETLGVIRSRASFDPDRLNHFLKRIETLRASRSWTRHDLVELFHVTLDNFDHKETGRFLDSRM